VWDGNNQDINKEVSQLDLTFLPQWIMIIWMLLGVIGILTMYRDGKRVVNELVAMFILEGDDLNMTIECRAFCDDCGGEILDEDTKFEIVIRCRTPAMSVYDSDTLIDIDLCKDCFILLDVVTVGELLEEHGEEEREQHVIRTTHSVRDLKNV
jgi:hypothetical protein